MNFLCIFFFVFWFLGGSGEKERRFSLLGRVLCFARGAWWWWWWFCFFFLLGFLLVAPVAMASGCAALLVHGSIASSPVSFANCNGKLFVEAHDLGGSFVGSEFVSQFVHKRVAGWGDLTKGGESTSSSTSSRWPLSPRRRFSPRAQILEEALKKKSGFESSLEKESSVLRATQLTSERVTGDKSDGGKKRPLRLLIAGGGIGGLVLALAAKNKGIDVKVFERDASAIRGEGQYRGPIQIQSNALAALEAVDQAAAEEIMDNGCVTGDRINGLVDGLTGVWYSLLFLSPNMLALHFFFCDILNFRELETPGSLVLIIWMDQEIWASEDAQISSSDSHSSTRSGHAMLEYMCGIIGTTLQKSAEHSAQNLVWNLHFYPTVF